MMPSHRFSKASRIRRRHEFKRVFDQPLRIQGRLVTILLAPNATGEPRLGIVASRKLGDAVRRNRAKRLIREAFRQSQPLPGRRGVDVVVIPRREIFDAGYAVLQRDFRNSFARGIDRLPADRGH